ncbi:MAG: hypothetical protein KIT10_15605 [Flavobacteriales bacterium]|nr:hypothetical protein [Flavobacteriales bacterium]
MTQPTRTHILLLTAVVAATTLLSACGGGTDSKRKEALNNPDLQVQAPSREDLLIVERMRKASDQEVKEYIGEVVNMELPEDYVIPQDIIDAGHPKLAAQVIADRYPEISGQQGNGLVYAVRQHPLLYRQLVMESKAMRQVYKDHETVRRAE